MIHDNYTTLEKHLSQIAELLLLNGTLTVCPGLMRGKMGIAIFFFHYARYTDNPLFMDYAMDVIGEMQNQIHANSPADYEKGIAGIGVGIDYLIRNDFLDSEDDIFEDFDARMFRAVMYDPWQDFSLYDGLTGYGRYWISRLRKQHSSVQTQECLKCIMERIEDRYPDIPLDEQTDIYCFLYDLQKISGFDVSTRLLEQYRKQSVDIIIRSFPRLGDSAVGNTVRMYQRERYFNEYLQDEINSALRQIPALDIEKPPVSTGLLSGYAGEGLLRLTALDPANVSWMELL
jgi:hypothetical protein